MSPYLIAALAALWRWVLAPPLQWLLSLSLEWQIELALLMVLVIFFVPIIEKVAIGRELWTDWRAKRKRRREWYCLGRLEPEEFHALISSLHRMADHEARLAERLEGRGGDSFAGRILRKAAWRRQTRAHALHDEADRLESLWQEIEAEWQNAAEGPETRAKVIRLMRRLNSSDDRAANGALAELKRMGNWFNWESLVPEYMTAPLREKLAKVLRLMAGTSNLEEARNAYRSALRILQENGWSRHWEVR